MKVTSHIQINREHQLRNEAGEIVGRAWKFPKSGGWGLHLFDVYWRNDSPNKQGGNTTTKCFTLRQCREKAATTLDATREAKS